MTEREFHVEVKKYLSETLPVNALIHHSSNESTRRRSKAALGTVAGWPDIEIFCNEIVLFIELKVGKNKLQANQVETHAQLQSNGFDVVTCWTLDEVKTALKWANII